ncbi:glycosyltransferase family 2 protein [Salmonella enterica]|uniref:glycosyltransferase family 2 protein n=1 Tax=Salmonella enterica TaxID=28901 RepID=UPI0012FDE616|nr:glycosyltransferase family 2 protein [Salmonella enterica]EIX2162843.1 glycosyltransferase family 2 protein [Salmonella enterica]EJF4144616.1 glycosyltransferase family 2 protein [Salmonella enterica]
MSIIIPAYNEERNIEKILGLLEKQTIEGFEVIVVDDGSTDNTPLLVSSYVPTKYSLVLLQQQNRGAAYAREIAINKSCSRFIAVIDCDDSIANDTLEKAIKPLLNSKVIDISLFKLNYVNNVGGEILKVFTYYTKNKILDGRDVFNNCIRFWGVHAFGIYKRERILHSYAIYHELNRDKKNYLNNDEVISRITFDISNRIIITDADYFFVNNLQSTTRRINKNYFKVINNVFLLKRYIENKKETRQSLHVMTDIQALSISTVWGVTVRYLKWRKFLNKTEQLQWQELISTASIQLISAGKEHNISISIKNKLQLIIIRCLTRKWILC